MKDHEVALLSDIIYKINTIEDFEEMRIQFLSALRFLVPCRSLEYYMAGETDRYTLRNPVSFGSRPDLIELYLSQYQFVDESRWNYYASHSNAYNDTLFLEEARNSNLPNYNVIYGLTDVKYQISLTIIFEGIFYGVVALQRCEGSTDFSEEDLQKLKLLAPHLGYRAKQEEAKGQNLPKSNYSSFPSYEILVNHYHLTLREIDVVYNMLQGFSKQEICDKLFISPNTLKKHTVNIYKKLGIKSWRELYQLLGWQTESPTP